MFKGFYQLASGMLTQSRVLNTVSNNMANASTPGYKKDIMATTTFKEVLMYRTGNMDKSNPQSLDGDSSMIRTVQELVTNFSQGAWDQTDQPLDFAISGTGFFQIETEDGYLYSRNGSFTLDDEGYLILPNVGRVMGQGGPILLGTDRIMVDAAGNIFGPDGTAIDQIVIADFADEDYYGLLKLENGAFQSEVEPATTNAANEAGTLVMWKILERSNVQAADEMVAMMGSQRALQSAAQVLKIYDQLMAKANEIGRV